MIEVQITAIKPYKKTCLRAQRSYLRHMLPTVFFHKTHVSLNILNKLPTPFLRITISRNRCYMGEDVSLIKFVRLKPSIKLVPDFIIWHYGMRSHNASYVESLRRSLHSDAYRGSLVANRCERNVLMTEKGKITMDFVAYYNQIMVVTKIGEPNESFPIPAYPTWIMRIAKDKQTTFFVAHTLQSFKIHIIISVLPHDKRIPHNFTMVSLWRKKERMIYRRHDNDLLIGFHKDITHKANPLYYTRNKTYPVCLYFPLMMRTFPINDSRAIIVRLYCVAQNRVFQSLL